MSADLCVNAACDCFITSLHGRGNVAMCRPHSDLLVKVFDSPEGAADAILAGVYSGAGS